MPHPTTQPDADILDPRVLDDVVHGGLRITPPQALRLYHVVLENFRNTDLASKAAERIAKAH